MWPGKGVYFFFETGEIRRESGIGPRVVRVGTHALASSSRATLRQRLFQHRGNAGDRGGNHRGSVFRKHVGFALLDPDLESACATWEKVAALSEKFASRNNAWKCASVR
jgi:hypothetical protein